VVRAIRDEHGELPFSLRWIIEGEEEVGSTHFASIAREHADLLRADAALWEGSAPDIGGRPEISIGFKGVLAFRLDVRTMRTDAHSGSVGVLPNAAWRLLEALDVIRGDAQGSPGWSGFHHAVEPPTHAARGRSTTMGTSRSGSWPRRMESSDSSTASPGARSVSGRVSSRV
jgi:acetylornithine deacetylase/succinyl-diaminopimelate desuccinylase-like protein